MIINADNEDNDDAQESAEDEQHEININKALENPHYLIDEIPYDNWMNWKNRNVSKFTVRLNFYHFYFHTRYMNVMIHTYNTLLTCS